MAVHCCKLNEKPWAYIYKKDEDLGSVYFMDLISKALLEAINVSLSQDHPSQSN